MDNLKQWSRRFESYEVERSVIHAMLSGEQRSKVWQDGDRLILQNRAGECFMAGSAEGANPLLSRLLDFASGDAGAVWRLEGSWLVAVLYDEAWKDAIRDAWGASVKWVERMSYTCSDRAHAALIAEGCGGQRRCGSAGDVSAGSAGLQRRGELVWPSARSGASDRDSALHRQGDMERP